MRPWSAQHVNLNLLFLKEPIFIKVCFKTFVTHVVKLYNFPNTSSKSIFQIALESLHAGKNNININESMKTPKGYVVSMD